MCTVIPTCIIMNLIMISANTQCALYLLRWLPSPWLRTASHLEDDDGEIKICCFTALIWCKIFQPPRQDGFEIHNAIKLNLTCLVLSIPGGEIKRDPEIGKTAIQPKPAQTADLSISGSCLISSLCSSRHELHSDSWQNASSENFYFSHGWLAWILYLRWHCIQRIKKQYNTNLILPLIDHLLSQNNGLKYWSTG